MKNFLIILLILMFGLSGCTNEDNLTIENKVNTEIEYVKKHCSIFIKKFDNGEYLKDGKLDLERINYDTTVFINSLPVIEDDLKFVKLNDNVVNSIDETIQNIRDYSQNNQYENLKNEYINLYNVFKTIEN